MSVAGITRLQKEYRLCAKEFQRQITADGKITGNYICAPDADNIFEWYFLVLGLMDEPYVGGYYLGKLSFPHDFPWKPPGIKFVTPSGRFRVNERICLSISDYHPESWNPIWHVEQIIIAAVSFFLTDASTVGSIETPFEDSQKIARASKAEVMEHVKFKALFDYFKPYIGMIEEVDGKKQEETKKEEPKDKSEEEKKDVEEEEKKDTDKN